MTRCFSYDDRATDYLSARDARLAEVIARVGHVNRAVDDDLFSSVVHHIVSQQISTKAQATIWARMREAYGEVTPEAIAAASVEELQALGMTFRKAGYIADFATRVTTGSFDLDAVAHLDDEEAICALCTINGVGRWTAEMILLFCLERPDVLAFDDLAIQRGMRMTYHHRRITRTLFERYRRRYSPCGSVASLYLWAVAAGGVPGFERDFAPRERR